ncbi:hypothetical protein BI364_06430 [Acidihalobacter yilgarnensis]|uniref:histidine kinase n=1 Tax=Acidihalobacter yilgarnensis TaxID=2819280 RepID=A0A1D8IMK1_9GAMM|nr:HDOD domain-containing protein [Acidihalobacter yilgarnensis]AOU97641.1 hypothetical protein BI364_06430 [Acidihalobacter yilgarnensis]
MNRVQTPQINAIDITCLPTLPQILFRLLDACESSERSINEIASLVRQDAALSARVLVLSCSPAYGQHQTDRRLNLEQILMLLGVNTLRTLALTAAVYQFVDQSLSTHSHRHHQFWHDALLTATLASKLAELSGYPSPHEAYLGGLLSGIGQIALLTVDPERYDAVLNRATDEPDGLTQHETSLFGIDHASLGALMLQRAGRRGILEDAVRFHHASTDDLTEAHHLVRLVAVANRLSADARMPPTAGLVAADRTLGLIPSLLEELHASAAAQTLETTSIMGIDHRTPAVTETAPHPIGAAAELARRVGDMNVIAAVRRQFADNDDIRSLLAASNLACQLLFGLGRIGYFLVDHTTGSASGYAANTASMEGWDELNLSLPSNRSLIGQALSEGQTATHYPWKLGHHVEDRHASVIDLEILGSLGTQGMLILALWTERRITGAVLVGLNAEDEARVSSRRSLLELFARELGHSITTLRQREESLNQALQTQADEYHLQASSIAHEVKNPLSIIKNYLGILSRRVADASPDVSGDLRIIDEEISRVGAIIRSLTEAADPHENGEYTDVNALVRDVISLLKPTLISPSDIQLLVKLDDSIPLIDVARNSVKQILVNLLKNAAEALGTGQTISVTTADYIYIGNKAYVGVEIIDDGPGLPPQVLATLFEPVSSTKGSGHAGLGLSITKKLVDKLHGTITCRSTASQGTHIQILLPRRLPDT